MYRKEKISCGGSPHTLHAPPTPHPPYPHHPPHSPPPNARHPCSLYFLGFGPPPGHHYLWNCHCHSPHYPRPTSHHPLYKRDIPDLNMNPYKISVGNLAYESPQALRQGLYLGFRQWLYIDGRG